jgi:hypothetical protein
LKEYFPRLFTKEEYELNFKIGPNPAYSFNEQGVDIEYSNDKLILSTKEETIKKIFYIQKLCSSIIKKLPHTPIIAIGHNFSFKFESESLKIHSLFDNPSQNDIISSLEIDCPIEKRFMCAFAFPKYKLNIFIINKKDEGLNYTDVSFNFHYQINKRDLITEAISSFSENYQKSKELYSKLVG